MVFKESRYVFLIFISWYFYSKLSANFYQRILSSKEIPNPKGHYDKKTFDLCLSCTWSIVRDPRVEMLLWRLHKRGTKCHRTNHKCTSQIFVPFAIIYNVEGRNQKGLNWLKFKVKKRENKITVNRHHIQLLCQVPFRLFYIPIHYNRQSLQHYTGAVGPDGRSFPHTMSFL